MTYPARRRARVLLLASLPLAAALHAGRALPPAAVPSALPDPRPGDASVSFPFEEDDGHILVRGRIQGSGPLWLILDSGATGSLIDSAQARALGLTLTERFQVAGAAGVVDAFAVSDASIHLPGVELRNQELTALPLGFLASGKGRTVAALLGADVFRRFVVEIDYAAERLHFHDPARYRPGAGAEVLPLTVVEDHPYVRAQLVLPGGRIVEGDFAVDTGSGFTVMLAAPFAARGKVVEAMDRTIGAKAQGVGGEILLAIGRLQGMRLGRFLMTDPVAVFPQNFGGEVAARGKAGNIGAGLLRRFRVTFDYPHGRLILEPNAAFASPDEYDMSGVSLRAEGDTFDRILVSRVMDLSPASEAGLKREDRILSIDGRPAGTIGLAALRDLFRQPGKQVSLDVQRDGKTLSMLLKTRRMI